MLDSYFSREAERRMHGIPPLPLSAEETAEVCRGLEAVSPGNEAALLHLIKNRVSPGVDPAAKVKAEWLAKVAGGERQSSAVSGQMAVFLLGTMLGGYNVGPLVALLEDPELAVEAAEALKHTILVYGAFDRIVEKARQNPHAEEILRSWAEGEWFLKRPDLPPALKFKVFKVDGEINTDDLSPGKYTSNRADIPLHALSMGEARFPGGIGTIAQFREEGYRVVFVGDVVGTGSSRKSSVNSVMWHIGEDIPFVPNKRRGGVVIGGLIAPIFLNTMEDSGGLPLVADVKEMQTGDLITLDTAAGDIRNEAGKVISHYECKPSTLRDEFRAGGRLNLIIGRNLTASARKVLGLGEAPLLHGSRQSHAGARTGLHPGAEDGRQGLRRGGHPPGDRVRAPHVHRRFPGHHRAHECRRTQGTCLPGIPDGPFHAVLLPHRGLSQSGRGQGPPGPAGVRHSAKGRRPQAGRRGHPLLVEPARTSR